MRCYDHHAHIHKVTGLPKPSAYWYRANWWKLNSETDARADVVRIITLLDGVDDAEPGSSGGDGSTSLPPAGSRGPMINVTTLATTRYASLLVDDVPLTPNVVRVPAPGQAMFWSVPATVAAASTASKSVTWPTNLTLLGFQTDPASASLQSPESAACVAKHTVLRPRTSPTALELTVDVPSPSTATGTALVLDGEDSGLIRASLRDSLGILCSGGRNNGKFVVTFKVVSGPARIVGAASGDPSAWNGVDAPTGSMHSHTYGGMASAVVQVSVDCTSLHRDLITLIDVEGGDPSAPVHVISSNAAAGSCSSAAVPIVITATATRAAGAGQAAEVLLSNQIAIPTSIDFEGHSPVAVARREASPDKPMRFFDNFDG